MKWADIFAILFLLTLLYRMAVMRFILIVFEWQRKHVPGLYVNGIEKIGYGFGNDLFSSFLTKLEKMWSSLLYCIIVGGVVWFTFWREEFTLWLSIFITVISVLSWLTYEAILFLPSEKFSPIISRLPASLKTSKNSSRNWGFVFIVIMLSGWLFISLVILVS
jgi:hypothetical protein